MRRSWMICWCACVCTGVLSFCWMGAPESHLAAQDKSKSKNAKKKGSSNVLDVKANEIQGSFIKEAETLAGEYYELKEFDKARTLLLSIQALEPNRPNLAAKLKLLDEDQINSNETELEVNAGRVWEATGILAVADKPIRIKAEGNYKFVISSQLGPKGFSTAKMPAAPDLIGELPVGALIGIIVPSDRAAGGAAPAGKEDKQEKPFLVGEGCDYTPRSPGLLYLRINAPQDNKNSGRLKVRVSGGTKIGK